MLLLELNRIANHLLWVGTISRDAAIRQNVFIIQYTIGRAKTLLDR